MLTPHFNRNGSFARRGDVWLLVLAAALLFFAIRPLSDWRAIASLLDRGVVVPAHNITTTVDAAPRYSVDVVRYHFQPEDGTAVKSGVERYRRGLWPDLDPLDFPRKFYQGVLNVRYLPEDPRVNRLDVGLDRRMSRSRRSALWLLASAAVAGTMGAVLLVRRLAGSSRGEPFATGPRYRPK